MSPKSPEDRDKSGSPAQKREENQIDIRIGDRNFEQKTRPSVSKKASKKGGFASKLINIMRMAAKRNEEMNRYN